MKSNQARGSAFDEFFVQEPQTRNMTTDLIADLTGFRLAHDSAYRVARGGSWDYSAGRAWAAYRSRGNPGNRGDFLGFRLVREDT